MFTRSVAMGSLIALAFTGATPARADIITIDAVYKGNNNTVPVVNVSVKDKNGNVITVKAAIDTANANTTTISSDIAAQLGVTGTGTATQKTGGGATNVQTGSLAGNDASVAGAGGKSAPLPNAVAINPNLPAGTMILGGDFLKSFGDWAFQKKKGKVVLTADNEVSDLNLPLQTPLTTALAEGTVTDPGNPGFVPVIDLSLASASTFAVEPFVVSTWSDFSLISMSTADALAGC